MSATTYKHTDIVANVGRILTNVVAVRNTMRSMYDFLNAQAHRSDYGGLFGIDDLVDLDKLQVPISTDFDPFDLTNIACLFEESMNSYGMSFAFSFSGNYRKLYYDYALEWKFRNIFSIPGEIHGILHEVAVMGGGSFNKYESFPETRTQKNNGLNTVKSVLANLPKNAAKGIGRMRQLLTQIEADERWDEYYEYDYIIEAHMEECDECMEDPDSCDIYNDLRAEQDALYNDIMSAFTDEFPIGTELASTMADPYTGPSSIYYDYGPSNMFENPLVVVHVNTSRACRKTNGSSVLVAGATLLRKKKLTGVQCYDYNESSPFTGGNPNFVYSNYFTWLNNLHYKKDAWKVPSHAADTFRTGTPYYGYLACCDDVLCKLLTATVESQQKILDQKTLAYGTNANYSAMAWVTLLTAGEYGLPYGANCGTHPRAYIGDYSSTKYFAKSNSTKRQFEIAPVGTQASYLNLITKSPLRMTTSSTNPYSLIGGIDSSGNFTGASINTYTAIQPAHHIVGFHMDELVGADPQYLRGVKTIA